MRPCKRTIKSYHLSTVHAVFHHPGHHDWIMVGLVKQMHNQGWKAYCCCGYKTDNITSIENSLVKFYKDHLYYSDESAKIQANIDYLVQIDS